MENFAKAMRTRAGFAPRTLAQAIAAMGEGAVGRLYCVHKGVSARPVFEEPWEFLEIERLLARDDLPIDTTALLMRVFESATGGEDKEEALFAAESIDAIESRHVARLRSAKAALEGGPSRETLAAHSRACLDLAAIYRSRPVLTRFYLETALAECGKYRDLGGLPGEDAALEAEAELALGNPARALEISERAMAEGGDAAALLFASAKAAFAKGDFRKALACLREHCSHFEDHGELTEFWTGGSCVD